MKPGDFFSSPGFSRLLFDSARDAILLTDRGGRILDANTSARELFGYDEGEMLCLDTARLLAPEENQKSTLFPEFAPNEGERQFEMIGVTKTGNRVPLDVSRSVFEHAGNRFYLHILRDISERKKAEEEIYRLANIDPLTGLPNRRFMRHRIDDEKARSERSKRPFSFIIADIDDFKPINDNYGHDCGDYILVELSRLMEELLRKQDIVSRWGGEEFLFLLPETDKEGAVNTAEKIRRRVEEKNFIYDSATLNLTMTFGVASAGYADDIQDRIKRADSALLLGKNRGKNCVVSLD
ncbi:MAG: diguanylate cyclase [Spirochaetia bacterium]